MWGKIWGRKKGGRYGADAGGFCGGAVVQFGEDDSWSGNAHMSGRARFTGQSDCGHLRGGASYW